MAFKVSSVSPSLNIPEPKSLRFQPLRLNSSSTRGQLFGRLTSIALESVATVALGAQSPDTK